MIEPVDACDGGGSDNKTSRETENVLFMDIGAVSDRSVSDKIFANLLLGNDHLQKFQLDTGATANIIPQHVYKTACQDQKMSKLRSCTTSLVMFNKSTTKPVGKTTIDVMNPKNGLNYTVEFLVVRADFSPLLGARTLQEMNLISVRTENIASLESGEASEIPKSKEDLHARYIDVFTGIGRLPGKLHIQTDETKPPVQLPTRPVPEALKEEVRAKLDRMERDGIIVPVSEPTEWISAMVAVRKANKGIRICIDPKPLNQVIKRNHFPLPTIEDIIPELAKAKVFTVCDAKSGYWHVELDRRAVF